MKRDWTIHILFAFIGIIGLTIVGLNIQEPKTTSEIVESVKDGTVLITNEAEGSQSSIGTGFILAENYIVTNNHVIDGQGKPNKLNVISPNSSKKYEAKVIYTDNVADVAVIGLVEWDKYKEEQHPIILSLGNSDDTRVGDKIVVMGHPWGLMWSVSEGIMSAKYRRVGPNPRFIDQVDAHLFQGNSGGPIFNEYGKIVCISNMMLAQEGGSYGFCIPSNLVQKILYDFNTFAEIRWRTLNVTIALTDDGTNVILQSVEPNGAAGKAGLKEGDKILEVYTPNNHPQGKKIAKIDQLITEMATMKGDDDLVKMLIDRNGERMLIDVHTNYKLSKEFSPDKMK